MNAARHGLVVLAAGASRRLGQPKQLLALDGETLVHRAARLGLGTAPLDAVVVLGEQAQAIAAALADLPLRLVVAREAPGGMGHSLRAGLAALDPRCDGALVLLCDQPALDAAHLAALLQAWLASPEGAAASAYAGVLGVPALLPRAWFAALSRLDGDQGARELLRQHAAAVIAIAAPALSSDVDMPGDLDALGAGTGPE